MTPDGEVRSSERSTGSGTEGRVGGGGTSGVGIMTYLVIRKELEGEDRIEKFLDLYNAVDEFFSIIRYYLPQRVESLRRYRIQIIEALELVTKAHELSDDLPKGKILAAVRIYPLQWEWIEGKDVMKMDDPPILVALIEITEGKGNVEGI